MLGNSSSESPSQTKEEISEKWEKCIKNNNLLSENTTEFQHRMSLSENNHYQLSTMIGRCTINMDKIKKDFSVYYLDFFIKCRHKLCKATCPECDRWDGRDILLDDDVEMDISCCDNFCGIIIKEEIPMNNGDKKVFYGGEWFYLISGENSIPTVPLTKLKLETAYNTFLKEKEYIENKNSQTEFIQQDQREDLKDVKSNKENKFFTNIYLMKKLEQVFLGEQILI